MTEQDLMTTIAAIITDMRRIEYDINDPMQIEKAIDAAIEMIERMGKMEAALQIAMRQNSHDMLMTGDELRQCEAAMEKSK